MRALFYVTAVLLFWNTALRAEVRTTLEPIIGYERVQKLVPTPRTKERLAYGARLIVGVPLISGEAEVVRAQDTEVFPDLNATYRDTDDRARVGIRSTVRLVSMISMFLRAGAQARRTTTEVIQAGVSTTTTTPITYNPYAGAGLRIGLGRNLSFTADITTVFRNFPNFNDNDYMTTASFAVSFP